MAAPSADIDICNLALDLIKQNKNIVASITSPTSEEEITCARWYDATREALLRSHFWVFARKRRAALRHKFTISGATQADPIVITTSATHDFANGDEVLISDVVGMIELNDNSYFAANVTATTLELTDVEGADIDGTAFTAYSSAGTIVPYNFGTYKDAYDLPSDFLRLQFIGDDSINDYKFDYEINGDQILMNNGNAVSLDIGYIANISTVSQFDALFVILFAAELALNMSYKWTLSNSVIKRLETILEQRRSQAKAVNGQDRPPKRIQSSKFIDARRKLTTSVAGKFTVFEY